MARRLASLLALLLLVVPALHAAEPNRPVPNVDLARYAGTWYEQAHLPMFFQRDCARDTTATYTLRKDGRVDVLNRCTTKNGAIRQAQGVARRVGDSTSKLEVRFAPAWLSALPFVWGDYWVIGLDPDYRWAMVGAPGRDYLWILARDRVLDRATRDRLVERARAMGYPVDKLVFTPQG
ncbi:lipocalin family protein [Cognatilysobacter segetis]|uniref:lipocalin family protein n=1 Tax=Cognatilysobacter segetis TaxID=2492394 RepID=UPI00105E7416|nr:lipocalin family protein [Lysobacter segetis]